ncbi:ABC transporter periplasmic protein [Gluconacetobacter johannae DSM 13595]|uniref:MCE family protein n=1 Tax=Gluconacetobacter johannae TaxID=112140 RepID=A0A7W4J6Y5_9PROT|nr:MlaD family protein [Gluconacetobacter johannae]MBB2175865.1 MCE family protein [Gluconacetobacter johannae]GBQ81408.1 ABC transporter periplasmic protein [Gluconacetobacter johannae DSM 13595]
MAQDQKTDLARQLVRVRYADEWVGVLVLLSLLICLAAIIEAGVLRDWLTPEGRLRIVLPDVGVSGLSIGDDIEVLGIHAGNIRRIRINPSGGMYAVADIDPEIETYIRRDSTAVIRKRFVVAGANYIDISRGTGQEMDWHYAVVTAHNAPNPADMVTQTFADIRSRILPVLDSAQHMMAQMDGTITDLHAGKGTVGRLMTNDELIRQAEKTVAALNDAIAQLAPVERQMSAVMAKADASMANVRAATGDLRKASPRLPAIARNLQETSAELPVLLTQAQVTAASLQKLADQLRGLWLLGGGGGSAPTPRRLPAGRIQP